MWLLVRCVDDKVEQHQQADNKVTPPVTATPNQYSDFAGSASCAGCHKSISESHIHTAHYLTSQPAEKKYLPGDFHAGKNSFSFNSGVVVKMEKRDSGFYQVAYMDGQEKKTMRMDVVVGSATKGQSFLNWQKNELTQLPITWFTPLHEWTNSPGYPGTMLLNRPITARCLECHTTFVQKLSDEKKDPELFDPKQIVFGVDCEKCHGAAAKHVEFHQQHPADTTAKFITNPGRLTRQQNLDLCALCHGGRINRLQPSFTFKVGDKLSDYFRIDSNAMNVLSMDVHGNQYGLLAASQCFKKSDMTCSSCHNVHKKEKEQVALFSTRCMNCHSEAHGKQCKLTGKTDFAITNNCIDCHMPKQPSRSVAVLVEGDPNPKSALMRTHWIKPYPDETGKVLAFMKEKKKN